jgi:hypothetical protein
MVHWCNESRRRERGRLLPWTLAVAAGRSWCLAHAAWTMATGVLHGSVLFSSTRGFDLDKPAGAALYISSTHYYFVNSSTDSKAGSRVKYGHRHPHALGRTNSLRRLQKKNKTPTSSDLTTSPAKQQAEPSLTRSLAKIFFQLFSST